jgi:hypothetical protein
MQGFLAVFGLFRATRLFGFFAISRTKMGDFRFYFACIPLNAIAIRDL